MDHALSRKLLPPEFSATTWRPGAACCGSPPRHAARGVSPRASVLALAGLMLTFGVEVHARELPPYEGRFSPKADGMYFSDIHEWAYTEAFAKKFRMPAQWIEPGLEGAAALAYRVEFDSGRVCGYDAEPRCRRRARCVIDTYFDEDLPALFRNQLGTNHNAFGDDRSARFLSPQRREDFERMRRIRRSIEMPGEGIIGYETSDGQWHYAGKFDSFQHERRIREAYGVTNISFRVNCGFGELADHDPRRVNLWLSETPVADPAAGHTDVQAAMEKHADWVVRRIELPAGYIRRIGERHQKDYARHAPAHDEASTADWRLGEYEAKTHAERFTEAADGLYAEDNHAWVYTPDFAERFGMPEKWASDQLQGAHAIAYWVDEANTEWCGIGGNEQSCRPVHKCVMDVYLPKSADLPWYEPVPVNHAQSHDQSLPRLSPETSVYQAMKLIMKTGDYTKGASTGRGNRENHSRIVTTGRRPISYLGIPFGESKGMSGIVGTNEYDRRLFGMDRIQLSMICQHWDRERQSPGITDNHILFSEEDVGREIHTSFDEGDFDDGEYWQYVAHGVEMPVEFIERIYDYTDDNRVKTIGDLATGQGREQ